MDAKVTRDGTVTDRETGAVLGFVRPRGLATSKMYAVDYWEYRALGQFRWTGFCDTRKEAITDLIAAR